MSGETYKGTYMENSGYIHTKYGHFVYSGDSEHHCFGCMKTVPFDELKEAANIKSIVMIARVVNGITINGDIEFLHDELGTVRLFENQEVAEEFLLIHGVTIDELDNYYYIELIESECDVVEKNGEHE